MVKEDNRNFNDSLAPNSFHFYGVMCLNTIGLFAIFLRSSSIFDNSRCQLNLVICNLLCNKDGYVCLEIAQ